MRVGHGAAPIPVPEGTPMGGYVDRRGGSSGTADPLEAHVVTVTDGVRRFALVVLDLVCVNADLAAAVRDAVPFDDVWVCATHTHSGPETGCVPGGSVTPEPWVPVVTTAVEEAVQAVQAVQDADTTPGTLTAAAVDVDGVASVRSTPDGARPVPVDVVSFHDGFGTLTGVLVVLPVHPTVLPASSTVVSADLTGAVRRALAERLGVWVVVLTGAAGDISTRGVRRGADPAECARLGEVVADQVVTAVRRGSSDGVVRTSSADVLLAPGTPPESRSTADPSSRQAETLRQAWRLRQSGTGPLPARVVAARLGDVRLLGVPGEPFLGLRSRAGGAVVVGYVGGYVGYLPTRTAFEGAPTYETVVSPVAPGEPERLVDLGMALLSRLDR
jgi:hypothetical protein